MSSHDRDSADVILAVAAGIALILVASIFPLIVIFEALGAYK